MLKRGLMGYTLLVAMCAFATGCVAVGKTYASDGRPGFTLSCGTQPQNCYKKAGELCGAKGYDVLDKADAQSGALAGGGYGLFGAMSSSRTMLIACKN